MRRPLVALIALAAAGALAAGCGSSNSGSGGTSSGGTSSGGTSSGGTSSGGGGGAYGGGGGSSATSPTGVATVATASTKLGSILVDAKGRTLYLFEKDQPNKSACSGACVSAWPVDKSSGTPKAGSNVKASLLGTIKRSDGTTQVTYNKHPLYYFSGDSGAGQHNGQGKNAFGALWYVVGPSGAAVTGANA
jgi:predicted lipoprotein with Yx(FWY)xxD motif